MALLNGSAFTANGSGLLNLPYEVQMQMAERLRQFGMDRANPQQDPSFAERWSGVVPPNAMASAPPIGPQQQPGPPMQILPAAQTAPQMPQQQQTPQQPSAGLGDHLSAGFGGLFNSPTLISGIGNAIQGFATGNRSDNKNLTMQALIKRGLDPETAQAAVSNPALMQAVMPQLFGGMTDDIKEFEYAKKQGFSGSLEQWMQRKRAGAGEYGLQPIWGVDKDGKPAIMQLGKSGEGVQSKMPEGFSPAKDPIKVDAGTEFVLLDPQTRQPIGRIPKNIEGKEAAEERGKATGQAQVGLSGALANGELAIQNIDQIRKHTGRKSMFGVGGLGWVPGIPGTDQAGFVALVDQLKGKTFLTAFESLKGGGAITEIEGTKAEKAIARLQRTQNDADFDSALKDLEDVVKAGMERARVKARGVTVPGAAPAQSPAAPAAPPPASGGYRVIGVR